MTDEFRREQLQTVAIGIRVGVGDKLGDVWWFLVLRGVLALALGIFALFWPDTNLGVLVLAVGLYCLADGALGLVSALRHLEYRERLLHALVVLAIGVVLVLWPGATLRTLLVLLGAAVLFAGVSQILSARRLPADDVDRSAAINMGIAAAVVGLVLALWPGSGVAVISWVIGIAALLVGALLIFLGSRFRRLKDRVETMGDPLR